MNLANSGILLPIFPNQSLWNQPLCSTRSFKLKSRVSFKEIGELITIRRCECIDLHKELVPYEKAWAWQKSIVKDRQTLVKKDEDHSDTLIVLQHPPVYTLGTGSSEKYLNFDIQNAPYDIYRTDRGGEVTYHGPGQLIMYPIINLRHHKMDLDWYLRSLEEVVVRALWSAFSIKASTIKGLTGVWETKRLLQLGLGLING